MGTILLKSTKWLASAAAATLDITMIGRVVYCVLPFDWEF